MPQARGHRRRTFTARIGLLSMMLLSLSACASEPPKPVQTVTPDQVRGHADKAFEQLKREDQNRAIDSTVGR